jgi:hypothetical protein
MQSNGLQIHHKKIRFDHKAAYGTAIAIISLKLLELITLIH